MYPCKDLVLKLRSITCTGLYWSVWAKAATQIQGDGGTDDGSWWEEYESHFGKNKMDGGDTVSVI